jgi:hypothetical protein
MLLPACRLQLLLLRTWKRRKPLCVLNKWNWFKHWFKQARV